MAKESKNVIIVVGRYRVIEVEEGVYRLQHKEKFSFKNFIRKRSPWRTLGIKFYNINRLKVCLFNYANNKKL